MAELVDALVSGTSHSNVVQVRVLSRAQKRWMIYDYPPLFSIKSFRQTSLATHYEIKENKMQYNENKAKIRAMREEFENMLRSTGREGVDDCLAEIESLGFFEAPASTRFHLNYDGGLMEHSLNVAKTALRLREQMIDMDPTLKSSLPEDSVIIATLLHDVCKADIYKPTVKRVKQTDGTWADEPGYDVDFTNFPMGHGEKSVVVLLLAGLALTNDEMLAMRWHMAAWDLAFNSTEAKSNINAARDICPLCSLVQSADTLAANLLERKK